MPHRRVWGYLRLDEARLRAWMTANRAFFAALTAICLTREKQFWMSEVDLGGTRAVRRSGSRGISQSSTTPRRSEWAQDAPCARRGVAVVGGDGWTT